MNEFQQNSCVLIKGFLDPQSVGIMSRYMEYALKRDHFNSGDDPESTTYKYADPLAETILYNSREEFEEITGLSLHPTYSFSRVYMKGDELKPHVDRPACEISVTVHVATQGEPWPIWMHVPGKEPVSYTLAPGDAIVYRGCDVLHWREKAVNTKLNAQFMLHYVDQNGPNARLKWDTRPSLGLPVTTKGM